MSRMVASPLCVAVAIFGCSTASRSLLIDQLQKCSVDKGVVLAGPSDVGWLQFWRFGQDKVDLYDLGAAVRVQTISPSATAIAGLTGDSQIAVVPIKDPRAIKIRRLDEYSGRPTMALSWDNGRVAVCGLFRHEDTSLVHGVTVLDLASTKKLFIMLPGPRKDCGQVSWHPSGSLLAVESSGRVAVLDTATLNVRQQWRGGLPAWSPDGAICFRSPQGELVLRDMKDLDRTHTLVTGRSVEGFTSWSPGGQYIAFGESRFYGRSYRSVVRVQDRDVARVWPVFIKGGHIGAGWLILPSALRNL